MRFVWGGVFPWERGKRKGRFVWGRGGGYLTAPPVAANEWQGLSGEGKGPREELEPSPSMHTFVVKACVYQ